LVKSDAFRNRGSPQLASAVTAEITQNINSPATGDKSGLLALERHKAARIVSACEFASLFL
jgi:hypothetical protein